MASTRRAALMAAPALIAASAAPGAEEPSPVIRLAAEAIAAERRSVALWDRLGATPEEEDMNLDACHEAGSVANEAGERLAKAPGKTFADVVAKARAAYLFGEKDECGVMEWQDTAHGLLISICEDVLALAGQPVPR